MAAVLTSALTAPLASGAFSGTAEAGTPACASAAIESGLDGCLHMNQVQVVGTHNSYHMLARPHGGAGAAVPSGSGYAHPPLTVQLDVGVRQLELDVYADPHGGRYRDAAARAGLADEGPRLRQPGFKVFHQPQLDMASRCVSFVECLGQIHTWSAQHPTHVPVMVLVEAKDAAPGAEAIDGRRFDELDHEIHSVFHDHELLTPDDVRAGAPTLSGAVRQRGWPTLAAASGKLLFVLDNPDAHRTSYLIGHPALRGRVMFTNAPPDSEDAAVVEVNDPVAGAPAIGNLVAHGYLVRTRADADTTEARAGATGRRDIALASGAQWVSTDYSIADLAPGSGYGVVLPFGAAARVDPVTGPRQFRGGGRASIWDA